MAERVSIGAYTDHAERILEVKKANSQLIGNEDVMIDHEESSYANNQETSDPETEKIL
jgi:hypothetical protein